MAAKPRSPRAVLAAPPEDIQLADVTTVCAQHPGLSPSAVRALIHRSKHNGLDEHIYRLGRRVFIDLNGFSDWVRGKQGTRR